jgi:hypothetical protein
LDGSARARFINSSATSHYRAMAYVPVQCSACEAHHLQLVEPGAVPNCRSCGRPASVLPGATYSAGDVELFDRVDAAVRADLKWARSGQRLAAELLRTASTSESPESILLRMIDDLPGLRFLLPALSVRPTGREHRSMLARSLGMLLTIVAARTRQLERAPARLDVSA